MTAKEFLQEFSNKFNNIKKDNYCSKVRMFLINDRYRLKEDHDGCLSCDYYEIENKVPYCTIDRRR